MIDTDNGRFQFHDIAAAHGLLTRLPVPVEGDRAQTRGAQAAWAYPLVGLTVGFTGVVVAGVAGLFGVPATLTAGIVLVVLVAITGAMHEDGLADCADGFWGGWDRARRLEIMKDSRIGAYGVIALVLSLLVRWAALVLLFQAGIVWAAIILPAMISRASMVSVMHLMPNARENGLSQSVGRPDRTVAGIAGGIAVVGVVIFWLGVLIPLALFCCGVVLAVMAVARAKISGQTGDVLGAVQQLTEIAALVVMASLAAA